MITNKVFKNLKVGNILMAEYYIGDGKIRVKRYIKITKIDDDYFYVDTGVIKNVCLHRSDFISIDEII